MNKGKSNSLIILLIIVFLGFLSVYYFLYHQIIILGRDVSDLSQKKSLNLKQEEEMKNLANSLDTTAVHVRKTDSYFISDGGEVAFIDQLENIARDHGLNIEINSVGIENPKILNATGLEYLILKMTLSGNWSSTYKFLSILPNLPYKIVVDSADLNIISDEKSSLNPVWQSVYTIRVLKKSN